MIRATAGKDLTMKKRFIALALIFVLAFSLASCDIGSILMPNAPQDTGEVSAKILAMYKRSAPTKSVTEVNYTFAGKTLTDKKVLMSGKIDGKLEAAILDQVEQKLRTVADGSNASILGEIEEIKTYKEYLEGQGVRTNGGAWDSSESNFAPTEGSIALNVSDSVIVNVKETGNTITFVIAKDNTERVFGKPIGANVSVSVKHDGASIVEIRLDYIEPATSGLPEMEVSMVVNYYYGLQNITIG